MSRNGHIVCGVIGLIGSSCVNLARPGNVGTSDQDGGPDPDGSEPANDVATGGQGGSPGSGGGAGVPAGYKPSIVVIGYSGLRILSRDLGLTWGNRVQIPGGKDSDILGIVYAQGLYVALGDSVITSPDGATWTGQPLPVDSNGGNAIAFGNGMFLGTGYCGETITSANGIFWTLLKVRPGAPACTTMQSAAFGAGQFAVAGQASVVYVSTDATAWTELPGLTTEYVAYCNGAFRDRGACPAPSGHGVSIRFSGKDILRSVDNITWETVHQDPVGGYIGVAFGFSPP